MNRKEFVIILIITFLVIMVWIVAEIIHSKPSVSTDSKLQGLLDPVDPNFDQSILEKIRNIGQSVKPVNPPQQPTSTSSANQTGSQ